MRGTGHTQSVYRSRGKSGRILTRRGSVDLSAFLAERAASVAYPFARIELVPGSGETLWDVKADATMIGSARRLKLDAPVWAHPAFGLELNLEALPQIAGKSHRYEPIPATPRAQVDLALVASTTVTAAQIEAVIRRGAGKILETLTLFVEIIGQGIPEGSRSLFDYSGRKTYPD